MERFSLLSYKKNNLLILSEEENYTFQPQNLALYQHKHNCQMHRKVSKEVDIWGYDPYNKIFSGKINFILRKSVRDCKNGTFFSAFLSIMTIY